MTVHNTKSLHVYSIARKGIVERGFPCGLSSPIFLTYRPAVQGSHFHLCPALMDSIFPVSQDGGEQMLCSWAAVKSVTVIVKWAGRALSRKS